MQRKRIKSERGLGFLWRGETKLTCVRYGFTIHQEFHRARAPQPENVPGRRVSDGRLTAEDRTLQLRDEDLELELGDGRRLPVRVFSLFLGQGRFHLRTGEAIGAYLAGE